MQIKSFKPLEYDGLKEPALHAKCKMWACGRWTKDSLYHVFMMGKESGSLEHTLNHLGLTSEDLTPNELDSAKRIYLISRAKNLSGIQASLTNRAGNAKEAELLLERIYGIGAEENAVVKSVNPIGISFEVKDPVGDIKVTRGK